MEHFTAIPYEAAMQFVNNKFKNAFDITVMPNKNISKKIDMNDNLNPKISKLISTVKKELKPVKELQMEISLLRQEVDLLSKRIHKLIHPEINKDEKPIYNSLCEIGFENPLALKFTRELSSFDKNSISLDNVTTAFDKVFQNLLYPISIKNGDAIVLFGQEKSGKSKVTELITDELFNIGSVHIRKKIDLEEKIKNGITIIDSPAIHFDEMGAMKNLSKLADKYKNIYRILVISASTGVEEMLHLIASFAPVRPNYILFTKFNETIRPGKLLNVLHETGLKMCGLTNYSNKKIEYTNNCKHIFVNTITKNLGFIQ